MVMDKAKNLTKIVLIFFVLFGSLLTPITTFALEEAGGGGAGGTLLTGKVNVGGMSFDVQNLLDKNSSNYYELVKESSEFDEKLKKIPPVYQTKWKQYYEDVLADISNGKYKIKEKLMADLKAIDEKIILDANNNATVEGVVERMSIHTAANDNGYTIDAVMYSDLISAPGVFTDALTVNKAQCALLKERVKTNQKNMENGDAKLGTSKDEVTELTSGTERSNAKGNLAMNDMTKSVVDVSIGEDGEEGFLGVNCSELSFMENLMKIYSPVNITHSGVIMNMVFAFQLIAVALAVLLVSVFGIYVATGNETTDPVKFVIRVFLVLMVVYNFPYFAQDILNINNRLVYWIAADGIQFGSGQAYATGGVLAAFGATSLIMANLALMTSIVPGAIFVFLLILIYLIGVIVKALITLTFWWYARLLMIIFLVVLGPVFMVMMILPKTANYGAKWLQFFIGEVFTQTFLVIGFYFVGNIFQNLGQINTDLNFSFVGNVFLMYASFILLSRIPQISKSLVGGDMGGVGWNDAQKLGQSVGGFVQNGLAAGLGKAASKFTESRIADKKEERAEAEHALNNLDTLKQGKGESEKEFKERKQRLEDKLNKQFNKANKSLANYANKAEKGKEAQRMASSMKNGAYDVNKSLGEALEKDVVKDEEGQLALLRDEYGKKRKDATAAEVRKDLFIESNNLKEARDNAIGRANELLARKNITPEKRDEMVANAQTKYNAMQEKLKHKMLPENVNKEVAKRKLDSENFLKDGLNKMYKGKFDNAFQQASHVSTMARNIMKEHDSWEQEYNDNKKEAHDNLNKENFIENYAPKMDTGTRKVFENQSSALYDAAKGVNTTSREAVSSIANKLISSGEVATKDDAFQKAESLLGEAIKSGGGKDIQMTSESTGKTITLVSKDKVDAIISKTTELGNVKTEIENTLNNLGEKDFPEGVDQSKISSKITDTGFKAGDKKETISMSSFAKNTVDVVLNNNSSTDVNVVKGETKVSTNMNKEAVSGNDSEIDVSQIEKDVPKTSGESKTVEVNQTVENNVEVKINRDTETKVEYKTGKESYDKEINKLKDNKDIDSNLVDELAKEIKEEKEDD